MRTQILVIATATLTAACASQTATEQKPAAEKKEPMCWSGDAGKFFKIGEKATNAGIAQTCTKTADGKGAVWMSDKHK